MTRFLIEEQFEGYRTDAYLALQRPDLSRSKIQTAIKSGKVLLNNCVVKPSATIKENDIIEIEELTFTQPEILPENIPIEVIWEDENMVVINKPSGMLTHPTAGETTGTLVNALLHKFGDSLSDIGGDTRRGIIHRLDRNTSGLLMIAKNNATHEYLTEQMRQKAFCKKYLAIVRGIVQKENFTIDSPIGRHPTQPHKQAIIKDGKESISVVKVLEHLTDATLIEVTLITGRTHQIRVHMASIGHPVYNDTLYGFGKIKIHTEEQVLQSYKLEFTKPFSQERISLEIPPDEKITKILKTLRKN